MSMSDPQNAIPPPSERDRELLVHALKELEANPEGNPARAQLRTWLEQQEDPEQAPQIKLEELQELVQRRRKEGKAFELPDHVRRCAVSLDLFQAMLSESPSESRQPMSNRKPSEISSSLESRPARSRPQQIRVLAIGFVASALFVAATHALLRPPRALLEEGVMAQGSRQLKGGFLPGRKELESLQASKISLLDGTLIRLEPGSRIRLGKTLRQEPRLFLLEGSLSMVIPGGNPSLSLITDPITLLPSPSSYEVRYEAERVQVEVSRGSLNYEQPDGAKGRILPGQLFRTQGVATPDKSEDTDSER